MLLDRIEPEDEVARLIDQALEPLGDFSTVKIRTLAIATVRRILEMLEIDDIAARQLLGGVTLQDIESSHGRVSNSVLMRIEMIRGLLETATEYFGGSREAGEWLRKKNAFIGYEVPLEMMLTGELGKIVEIRRYFDARLKMRPVSK